MANFGQHFLANRSAIKKIVEALDIKKGDVVVEIGAGHGELTEEVIKLISYCDIKNIRIIAIEQDKNLITSLKEKFLGNNDVEVVEGDALKILPKLFNNLITNNSLTNFKLVGNIPYYITGKLLRLISELECKPGLCVFTVQKEVAERICAQPKNGMNPPHNSVMWGMNRLAASVQFWAKPEIIGYISRNDFEPKPEVDSAVLFLRPAPPRNRSIDPKIYYQAVRILFQQPRKTILNNLAGGAPETPKNLIVQELEKIGINPGGRPQNLSLEEIIKIGDILQ